MSNTLRLRPNRRIVSIPSVTEDPHNHTQVLLALKQAMEVGKRDTSDILNSFLRVQDLVDLGLIDYTGGINSLVGADLSQIANIGDLTAAATGDFLRFDGSEWINQTLANGDVTQLMVTQHQAALAIAWSQLTSVPTTLAGYGITDAYTETEVNTLLSGYQPLDSALTAYAGGDTPSAFTLGIVDSADAATWRTAIGAGTSSFDGAYTSLSSIPAILTEFTGLADASGVLTNDGAGNLSWGAGGGTYTAGDGLDLVSDEFSVDEGFAFTWTGQHTFYTASGSRYIHVETDDNAEAYLLLTAGSAQSVVFSNHPAAGGGYLYQGNYLLQWASASGVVASLTYGNSTDLPDHLFYGDFTGTNNFVGTPAYTGTTTGWSLGKDGTYPSKWSYRSSSAADERRWAWYHGLAAGGAMQLLAWTDDANSYRAAFGAFRSGVGITDIELGNSTDSPNIALYGPVFFRADMWHKDFVGNNRFYFQNDGRTYFGVPTNDGSIAYEWRNGADTAIARMRDDGWLSNVGILRLGGNGEIGWLHSSALTYGTAYVYGTKGGYTGLMLYDAGPYPTFMSDGSATYGVYQQGGTARWSWMDSGGYFRVYNKLLDYVTDTPYVRVSSGGSANGGRITISTSAPSGTPEDGDIWIQRAA